MQENNPLKDFSTLGVHPFKKKVQQIYAAALQNNHTESELMDELDKVMEKFKKKVVHPDEFVKVHKRIHEVTNLEDLNFIVERFKEKFPDDSSSKMFVELAALGIAKSKGWMNDGTLR